MKLVNQSLRTLAVAGSMIAATPLVHAALGRVVSQDESIAGEPIVARLLPMVCLQAVLLVVVFHQAGPRIPARRGWTRGVAFAALFLLAVQVPSVFGIVAFEPGHEWELFTPAKVANHVTLLGDTIVYLAVGALLGLLFPLAAAAQPRLPRGLARASLAGAAAFPLLMWACMHLAFGLAPLDDPNAPTGHGLWFDLLFYGAFSLTGVGLPLLHALLDPGAGRSGLRGALRSTGLFALLWLPVQNFMVVFGWEVGGALYFSAVSMVPVFLVLLVGELLIPASRGADAPGAPQPEPVTDAATGHRIETRTEEVDEYPMGQAHVYGTRTTLWIDGREICELARDTSYDDSDGDGYGYEHRERGAALLTFGALLACVLLEERCTEVLFLDARMELVDRLQLQHATRTAGSLAAMGLSDLPAWTAERDLGEAPAGLDAPEVRAIWRRGISPEEAAELCALLAAAARA